MFDTSPRRARDAQDVPGYVGNPKRKVGPPLVEEVHWRPHVMEEDWVALCQPLHQSIKSLKKIVVYRRPGKKWSG